MIEDLKPELIRLSGSGKRVVSTRRHGLYSTMTLPGFEDMPAVRDTAVRFSDFGIPDDLKGQTFLDMGSNVGAMAFEAARRGAVVTGVEYRQDRVDFCNEVASRYHEYITAKFFQADFNASPSGEWSRPHDLVLCSSVDEYIEDRDEFYELLHSLCKTTLYLESNVQERGHSVDDMAFELSLAGFSNVDYLGNGHSGGIQRRRKLFRVTP